MKSSLSLLLLSGLLLVSPISGRVGAQIVVIDDVILLTNRQKKQEEARTHQHLDPPGGENLLPPSPGADDPRLGEERTFPLPLPRGLARRGKRRGQRGGTARLRAGAARSPRSEDGSPSGPLDVPREDEGPADALTLDVAIERLLAANSELAAKYQDIPKARADVLTARLRSNPFLFLSISDIPYGHFSAQRPASTSYDLTLIQPLDVNGKRGCRIQAAQEAASVLESQYQDAARLAIDKLAAVYIDVLEARQTVRAIRAGLAQLNALEQTTRTRAEKNQAATEEMELLALERVNAEIALPHAEAALLQARRELALLLGLPAERAETLEMRGSLHDFAPAPPCLGELISIALQTRPDLVAYRLGIHRAQADLRRERAEAIDNVFLFYTPFSANDYSPVGKQSASGWGVGVLFPIPLFDRNQGDIARAQVNVTQTRLELQSLERHIVNEVQYAATEYALSREVVQQYERDMLADARRLRDEQSRLFAAGQAGFDSLFEMQKEYEEIVREYLEALAYHRRTMLRLNGAVGQRILP
jgi:cobalt-zinc-cadmium efflux system outer membrane protein